MSSQNISYVSEQDFAEEWAEALLEPPAPSQLYIPNVCEWAEDRFYIIETKRPILLEPVQEAVLNIFFEQEENGRFRWSTGLYSTVKKSGKTTVAGLVQRWAAECWGDFGEIYHLGNKQDQAKDRAFKITKYSIELAPRSERSEWDLQATKMTYRPTNSFIQALPVNAAGNAGGNQRLTTWTEFHGYVYEEHHRLYAEMQPVPTQPISFRFVESYAGYEGESLLLREIWDKILDDKGQPAEGVIRLHDEYPIYGLEKAGLVAYIDTGIEARRMPWQTADYYAEQAENESALEFQRIHFNEWVGSTEAFVPLPTWDALKSDDTHPPDRQWVTLAADASINGDCTAVTAVWMDEDVVVEAATVIFEPDGQDLDYEQTLVPAMRAMIGQWRVKDVAYDRYQLHYLMTELAKEYRTVNFLPFSQGQDRILSDTALRSRIQQGKLRHTGDEDVRIHIQNAVSKEVGDSAIRIIKKRTTKPIDAVITLGMAAYTAAEHNKPRKGTARKVKTNLYRRGR